MPVMKIEGRRTLGVTGVPNNCSMLFLIWYLYGAIAILSTLRGTCNLSGAKLTGMPSIPFQGQRTLRHQQKVLLILGRQQTTLGFCGFLDFTLRYELNHGSWT